MPMKNNRLIASYLLLLSALLLSACSENQQPAAEIEAALTYVTPLKSPNDRREYRALVLDNELKVLLISDPQAETAAASADVNSGYNSDPLAFQGLAHFLEHMLFLGTDKYPAEGDLDKCVPALSVVHHHL